MPFFFRIDPKFKYRPGTWNVGYDFAVADAFPREMVSGHLLAWDPIAQKEVWRAQYTGPWNGGALATAGNLVFQGTAHGTFAAYRASDGAQLWEAPAGTGIVAAPISYELDGTQYVAVMAGWGGVFALAGGDAAAAAGVQRETNLGRLLVYRLGGKAELPVRARRARRARGAAGELRQGARQARQRHLRALVRGVSRDRRGRLRRAARPAQGRSPDLRRARRDRAPGRARAERHAALRRLAEAGRRHGDPRLSARTPRPAALVGGPNVLPRSVLLAMAIALTACGAPPPTTHTSDSITRRTIASGAVVGFLGAQGSHVWLGIPYAAPPVGALRWRAPQEPKPWPGEREAIAFGARCPQYASALEATREPGTVYGSEDCLTLNLWAPPDAERESLPVMFWIHGGGNVQGGSDFYDGAALAASQNVVVVTANYRLGPLGWLRHAALREGATPEEASGNYGTLDLVARAPLAACERRRVRRRPREHHDLRRERGRRGRGRAAPDARRSAGLFHGAIVESGGTRSSGLPEAEEINAGPVGRRGQSSGECWSGCCAPGVATRTRRARRSRR